ncbi:hypothetical protein BD769DRAFT_864255 [Suillus cothurnatus]|jgi:hypothetical protein|nr:hypothetical protein BD769DRAFT_82161 [Suillus cothurnatus]KAG2124715.1 hypothetical protein BD769DRAFT_864255 [Suillus cothurnatus]
MTRLQLSPRIFGTDLSRSRCQELHRLMVNHARPARSRCLNLEIVPSSLLIVPDLPVYIDCIKHSVLSPSVQSEKIVLILTITVGVSATPLHTSIIGPIGAFLGSSDTRRKHCVSIPCASDVRLAVSPGLPTRKLQGLVYLALTASWRSRSILCHD